VKAGGSSLRDHKRVDGELGYFQETCVVYDREGKPCKTPGNGTIKRIVQTGPSTFYCPVCQKQPTTALKSTDFCAIHCSV